MFTHQLIGTIFHLIAFVSQFTHNWFANNTNANNTNSPTNICVQEGEFTNCLNIGFRIKIIKLMNKVLPCLCTMDLLKQHQGLATRYRDLYQDQHLNLKQNKVQ